VPEARKEVRKAFDLALKAHSNMRRRSGEPYIYHPLEVARIVAGEIGLGKTSIVCALLHDVVEDTDFTLKEIEKLFGKEVAKIIDGLTKIKDIFDHNSPSLQAENFRKILFTLSEDVRVILIKLADRLHNMRTLDSMPQHKRLKIAAETTYLYAPLAQRFGLYTIKTELEDLALKYTEPEIYKTIHDKIVLSENDRKMFVDRFILPIRKTLDEKLFKYEIISRNKSVYSIWSKMKNKEIPMEEVFDLYAVRIIIDTPVESEKVDCWRVYSIITDHYRPNIDRLRDWISIPKANGYEALHTTVMSHSGQWVEVQIRTKRMDEIAERGYAAHWRYKDGLHTTSEQNINNWLERIRDMLRNTDSNALDFIDDFQGFLFTDEIYVFTPQGELRNLPQNSTVLDFAYAIHSEIGNTCIGAKVNHKLTPVSQKLKSGDQVEIITSKKQFPREDWFNYTVTARARTRIKQAIRDEKKKYADAGKEKLQEYFKSLAIEPSAANFRRLQQKYNYTAIIDLYYEVAMDKIGFMEIKDCCTNEQKESWLKKVIKRPFTKSKPSEKKTLTETIIEEISKRSDILTLDNEVQKISYDISNCCNPIPGDDVVGFLNPNEAIKIHRTMCPRAKDLMSKYGNKIIQTVWNDKESIGFLTSIKIEGIDKKGFIKEIINVITEEQKLNIKSFHLDTHTGIIRADIYLYVYSKSNLNNLLRQLKKIPDVKKAEREIGGGFEKI
jgi:GTP pyrophosphokinase